MDVFLFVGDSIALIRLSRKSKALLKDWKKNKEAVVFCQPNYTRGLKLISRERTYGACGGRRVRLLTYHLK